MMQNEAAASISWDRFSSIFLQHFQHPHQQVFLQTQIRRLRMGSDGIQRYTDQFLRLAERLNWSLEDEGTIFQYKSGLTTSMLQQLSIPKKGTDYHRVSMVPTLLNGSKKAFFRI